MHFDDASSNEWWKIRERFFERILGWWVRVCRIWIDHPVGMVCNTYGTNCVRGCGGKKYKSWWWDMYSYVRWGGCNLIGIIKGSFVAWLGFFVHLWSFTCGNLFSQLICYLSTVRKMKEKFILSTVYLFLFNSTVKIR